MFWSVGGICEQQDGNGVCCLQLWQRNQYNGRPRGDGCLTRTVSRTVGCLCEPQHGHCVCCVLRWRWCSQYQRQYGEYGGHPSTVLPTECGSCGRLDGYRVCCVQKW